MTRETKIGLVVGLGFIVVFGILLSQRGADNQVVPPVTGWLGGVDAPAMVQADQPSGTEAGEVNESSEASPAGRATTPDTVPPPVAGSLTEIELPAVGALSSSDDAVPAATSLPADSPTPSRLSTPSQPGFANPRHGGELPRRRKNGGVDEPWRGDSPDQIGTAGLPRHHVVASGETLFGLARKYYGRSTPEAIDAIYEANREVLADGPHSLKVSQRLTIPSWAPADKFEVVRSPFAVPRPAPEPSSRVPIITGSVRVEVDDATAASTGHRRPDGVREDRQPATASAEMKWHWYRVGPDETYYNIADKKLGSPGRWQEIYELNKSAFPDPRRIPVGSRIKLPGA